LLEKKNSKEMKRKIWKKIHLICIRVQEKRKKQVRKCVAEGFPPFIVEDFYTGKFGWEVERCLQNINRSAQKNRTRNYLKWKIDLENQKNKKENIAAGKESQENGHNAPFSLGGCRKNILHPKTHDKGGKHEKCAR
jgi:hypothetical protein